MTDTGKQGFYAVKANVEELEQKIRTHRKKIALSIAAVIIIAAVFTATAGIYFTYKEYDGYETISKIERSDSEATTYKSFAGNILRYNNDGAFYTDASDHLIWNQAFEMQNPVSDICGDYAAIADLQGNLIYMMHTSGMQGQIKTAHPIEAVSMARQGTTAVLTQADGASYLEVYNKAGDILASGEIHIANSGYPLDIALSSDARKLAVSILDISKGTAKTTVAFYNFGSAGQNEIDNMVGSYSYDDTIISDIHFLSDDKMIAFGDNRVLFFEGRQSPKETSTLKLEREIKSIFYNEEFFGLVSGDKDSGKKHKMEIYDMTGKLRLTQNFKMSYQEIEFLDNHEICIRSEYACEIYTLRGVKKFSYRFDDALYKLFSSRSGTRYTLILDGSMQKIRLK